MVEFRVLGPVVAEDARGPVDLKGPRHRAVLARLLVARGRVVPVARLVDDLWEDDAPGGAVGAVQTFVGALRKALEPDRPPRTPARLLVTAAPGYALRAEARAVDAWRFEAAVTSAARLVEDEPGEARALLDEALALWRGPAYAEFADRAWARGEAERLAELRLSGVELRASAALALGAAAESVPELRAHVAANPLREDGRGLLALALYRAGRQGEALAELRSAREVLRAELGVDPGPALRRLEADVLAQAPHLVPPLADRRAPAGSPTGGARTAGSRTRPGPGQPFVGRAEELAELERAAAEGRRLVLLSGAAGAGKTALAGAFAERQAASGRRVAWGACPELPGVPAAWPWTQVREALGSEDVPAGSRFERHRAAAAAVAGLGPALLVLDDLHWADEETLALLATLVTDPAAGQALVVGTYRSTDLSPALTEALGRLARAEPVRVYLGGLTGPQVRELVRATADREPTPAEARAIHRRSGGNPFFVRELTRLWRTGGDAVLHAVPTGVRDVIRHRLAALAETARTHLRQAAVLGQDVDLDVLVRLAGDEEGVLTSVETALAAGFLVERDADHVRFAHALVREALYEDTTLARRARLHLAVADVLEATRPDEVEAIAHHLLRAGGRAAPDRTARHARAAAERAEHRFAPHEAARLWRAVLDLADGDRTDGGHTGGGDRLDALVGLVRTLSVAGDLPAARRYRAEAVTAAEALGDPVRTAAVIGTSDVPAIWTTNDDEALSARLVTAAGRTLAALPAGHDGDRARLLATTALESRADTTRRGADAAREAERIARDLDDPLLLATALNGRFLHTCHRAGLAPERARIGAELEALAVRHHLVTHEVLAHLVLLQAHAARADLPTADHHAAAADALAARHDLPLVAVFTDWYAALRLAITGHHDEAAAAYRAAAARLPSTGMPGLSAGLLPLALLTLDIRQPDADWGPYEPWTRPAADIPDPPHDLLLEARLCLHARAAVAADDHPAMTRLHAALLPARDELAGAGSGLLTLGPVARYLGDLAGALGDHDQAAAHYRRAEEVARKAGAPHWATAVRDR
ncbi:AfsR/SARP family transcriptional regulator [Saccharothrix yanglingensis]|uniref:SARP family transcriptional regulator n=1 Tax=Saccharothrix yanglingensis TaxID=659496 RepID=A0ABU0X434_9PSEU|nr:AfsR/SARP family transcriptional regulator [Saccharothrix yanglingensis]MDQ2586458.1 SARP family transcriptional regulator [Saccharothrix yanglingensis]